MRTTISSGTSSPLSMYSLASRPSAVSFSTLPRKMSPVAMSGVPYRLARWCACVPFPAPGGPNNANRTALPEETFVVAHQQLRFELLHGLKRHSDGDQD